MRAPLFYWLFEATEDGRYSDSQTPVRGWYWRYSQTINEVSHTQCAQYPPVQFIPWFSSGNHGSCSPALPEGLKGTENLPSQIIYLSPPYSSETHPLIQYTYRLLPPLMVNNGLCVFLFCNKDWNSTLWRLDSAESSIKKTVIHLCLLVLLVYNNGFPKLLFKLRYFILTTQSKQLAFFERNWFYVLGVERYSRWHWPLCVCRWVSGSGEPRNLGTVPHSVRGFLLPKTFNPNLGLIQPLVQSVPGDILPEIQRTGSEVNHSPPTKVKVAIQENSSICLFMLWSDRVGVDLSLYWFFTSALDGVDVMPRPGRFIPGERIQYQFYRNQSGEDNIGCCEIQIKQWNHTHSSK